jgi:hypothetical protein
MPQQQQRLCSWCLGSTGYGARLSGCCWSVGKSVLRTTLDTEPEGQGRRLATGQRACALLLASLALSAGLLRAAPRDGACRAVPMSFCSACKGWQEAYAKDLQPWQCCSLWHRWLLEEAGMMARMNAGSLKATALTQMSSVRWMRTDVVQR